MGPELGLGKARHADEKRVSAGEDRHQGVFNHPVLTEDDGGNRFLCRADLARDLFRRADNHVLKLFHTFRHWPLLCVSCRTIAAYCRGPMLNLCKGPVFVELNYPHFTGISGYWRHHDVATLKRRPPGGTYRKPAAIVPVSNNRR